jgi:hypothetical protein
VIQGEAVVGLQYIADNEVDKPLHVPEKIAKKWTFGAPAGI